MKLVSNWRWFRNKNSNEWYQIVTLDNGHKYIDDYPGCKYNDVNPLTRRPRDEIAHDWKRYIGKTVQYELIDCSPSRGTWIDSSIQKKWIRFISMADKRSLWSRLWGN